MDHEYKPWGMDINTFCMVLHLSQFVGGGIVLPVIMWVAQKDKSAVINEHGKIVVNWLLSCLIFGVAAALIRFTPIGKLLIAFIIVSTIVFAITGAIRAYKGEIYYYPLSIRFFK